jgi:hypothetical protein
MELYLAAVLVLFAIATIAGILLSVCIAFFAVRWPSMSPGSCSPSIMKNV